jgi:hypothetical protein
MNGGVIYTAIIGGKDVLRPPRHRVPGLGYVCFTDDPSLQSDIWEIRLLGKPHSDPTLVARQLKILAHRCFPDQSWSLWIDANLEIIGDLEPFLREHLPRAPFQTFRHYERRCAYEEIEACIEHKKACPRLLRAQAARYHDAGMPFGLPVPHSSVVLRRHREEAVVEAMERWWGELQGGSRRDQVSLPFVLWRLRTDFGFFFDGERPYHDGFPLLRRWPHAIEASYPCWATQPRRKRLVQIFRCWRCLGERPPLRVPPTTRFDAALGS